MNPWYERWFGEDYLELYRHRDEAEAEQLVALLARHGIGGAGDLVLDLACGAGRHAAALARRGARVVGLDLSAALLRRARSRGQHALVRGDMRLLGLRTASFAAVVNLFTSFGYFDADAEHRAVLDEVARVLVPGGWFVLDYLNATWVRAHLVARDRRAIGDRTIVQERRISADGRWVEKTITMDSGESFQERVRLFDCRELAAMLMGSGLAAHAAYGDYSGAPQEPTSPRCILLARRS
ncbi:MAG TPA: class I SAM-dependent methyltransferase [Gemmatimonadales bacterium]|nr:class I SAM-dependent methyltransferase [Gemmatimonadales bacterium]